MQTSTLCGLTYSLPLLSALVGCASTGGLITSLEDLSTESVKEGFVKVPQYRVASIPGWLPFSDVGGLYFYKPARKPASVIGLSPGASFELTSEIDGDACDTQCLLNIRTLLTSLSMDAQDLIQERIKLTLLQAQQSAGSPLPPGAAAVEQPRTEYESAQTKFNESYEKVVNAVKNHGVLIYRWSTTKKAGGSVGLDSVFGGSAQQEGSYNGFALVSGIRTKTLFVGRDLMTDGWDALNKKSRYSNRLEITTHVMQAKYIMYGAITDLGQFAQAKAKVSYTQLANIPETLKSLSQIEIEAILARVSNLSNMGVMGEIKRKVTPIEWSTAGLIRRLEDNNGWLTFYSVESDFIDLRDLVKEAPEHL